VVLESLSLRAIAPFLTFLNLILDTELQLAQHSDIRWQLLGHPYVATGGFMCFHFFCFFFRISETRQQRTKTKIGGKDYPYLEGSEAKFQQDLLRVFGGRDVLPPLLIKIGIRCCAVLTFARGHHEISRLAWAVVMKLPRDLNMGPLYNLDLIIWGPLPDFRHWATSHLAVPKFLVILGFVFQICCISIKVLGINEHCLCMPGVLSIKLKD